MKKALLSAAAAICAATLTAAIEEEMMIIRLANGNTVEYPVESVSSVRFEVREIRQDFMVTFPGADPIVTPIINPIFRVVPTETGQPVAFGFGTVETAENPADITAGEFGVLMSVSPSKVYTGTIDLAAEKSSYSLQLLQYEDGEVKTRWIDVTSGEITTSRNIKNGQVSIAIDAIFDDGTSLRVECSGRPSDVTSIDAMIPEHQISNEAFYYNSDEKLVGNPTVESVSKVSKKISSLGGNAVEFTFDFGDSGYVAGESFGTISILEDFIAAHPEGGDFNLTDHLGLSIMFGHIQLFSIPESNPNYQYMTNVDNGTLSFSVDADGTYHFHLDVLNYYTIPSHSTGNDDPRKGTNEHIILHYDGPVTGD